MKKILLITAMLAIGTGTFAQTACICKTARHRVHHKVAAHKTAAVSRKTKSTYTTTTTTTTTTNYLVTNKYRNGNACSIDADGNFQYSSDSAYMGYYPANNLTPNCEGYDNLLAPRYKDLYITSTAFNNYGVMPAKYSCQGEQVSPPLSIGNIPTETKSLAIVMYDPYSTPRKSTTYWLMWDVDTASQIPENFVNDHSSQNPINKQYGYQAVCPVSGTHYYHIIVYALDTKLMLGKTTNKMTLEKAMGGHVLSRGELVGQYNRHLD